MKKYTKKPVTIEAVQWTGNLEEIQPFVPSEKLYMAGDTLRIRTLEGDHTANVGDYIIKGVKGEFYPCKPDIFALTYYES